MEDYEIPEVGRLRTTSETKASAYLEVLQNLLVYWLIVAPCPL